MSLLEQRAVKKQSRITTTKTNIFDLCANRNIKKKRLRWARKLKGIISFLPYITDQTLSHTFYRSVENSMDWREWAEDTGGKQLKKKNNFIVFKIVYITLFSEILSKLKLCIDLFQGLYNFFSLAFFILMFPLVSGYSSSIFCLLFY